MTIRGNCEACGKAYRLPAGGRSYTCKACGGTVRAEGEEPEELVDLPPEAHHVTAREHRERIDMIHRRAARRSQVVYGAVLLVVGAGAYAGFRMTRPVEAAPGGVERELGAGAAEIARAWNAGDVDGLVLAFHPQGRAEFRTRIERVAATRGWTDGFAAARVTDARLTEGTPERPLKAVALLACEPDEMGVRCSLQYEPAHDRWFLYHVDIAPPPLAPTLESFRDAWALSSPKALAALFAPELAPKLEALVERKARELGWTSAFPELGDVTTTGELELRRATERIPGLKVESVFPIDAGELRVRWLYRAEPDAWYIAAVTFPKVL